MRQASFPLQRIVSTLLLVALSLLMPMDAYAQARSCAQLSNTIRQLDRNREFQNLQQSTATAQQLGPDLQRLERAFTQAGCQQALNNGQTLSGDCARAARQIQRGRRDMATLEERIRAGQAVAQQRQALIQQMQAQRCGTNSESNVTVRSNEPRGFFEQLFDSLNGNDFGNETIVDPFANTHGNTVRTVCVRSCDGYYWPVSFSTVPEYLSNDLLQCQQQARGADVDLYYYSNPGQSPSDMVNMNGQRYSALPNAFRYRNEFDPSCLAEPEINFGSIEIMDVGGQSRAVLSVEDRQIPLPLSDPRQQAQVVVAASDVQRVNIPLPRPRPELDAQGNARPVSIPTADANLRLVEIGGRVVRLVGPEPPYAQSGEEAS